MARVARVSLNLLVPLSYGAIAAPGGLEPPTDASACIRTISHHQCRSCRPSRAEIRLPGEQAEFGRPHMVELGFQRSIRFLHHLEVRHIQNKKFRRGAQGEIARRQAGQILPALLSADRDCSRRSLQQAPRFWDPGLPGRCEAALPSSVGGKKKNPSGAAKLGRGPKSRTGQPSVRRLLRERRARGRKACYRQGRMRSVDFWFFRSCVALVSR